MTSIGYGGYVGLLDLCETLKTKTLQDETYLNYLRHVEIRIGWEFPDSYPALFIEPRGTPEEPFGAHDTDVGVVAVHKCDFWFLQRAESLNDEDSIRGRTLKPGIMKIMEDALQFYNSNELGLSANFLLAKKPTLIIPDGAYSTIALPERSYFVRVGRAEYKVHLRPFMR